VKVDEACKRLLAAVPEVSWKGSLTLVDPHLKCVPGLGSLTARGLTGGDPEGLGGQTDGALDAELLVLRAVDELLADLLEGLDVARGQGNADLVDPNHLVS
jgi:hypothetical protein